MRALTRLSPFGSSLILFPSEMILAPPVIFNFHMIVLSDSKT